MSSTTSVSTVRGESAPRTYGDLDKQYIGGAWREGRGEKTLDDLDPWTGEVLLRTKSANADDVDDGLSRGGAMRKPGWAARPYPERARVLLRVAQILDERQVPRSSRLDRARVGRHARSRVNSSGSSCEPARSKRRAYPGRIEGKILPSAIAGMESRVYRQPAGVVGIISPWNFPFHLANRSIAPAIACGNAIVVKPASDTPVTGATLLAKIYEEAGLPPGVFNVVVGAGSEIGDSHRQTSDAARDLLHRFDAGRRAHRRVVRQAREARVPRTRRECAVRRCSLMPIVDQAVRRRGHREVHASRPDLHGDQSHLDRPGDLRRRSSSALSPRCARSRSAIDEVPDTCDRSDHQPPQLDSILEKVEKLKAAGARVVLDGSAASWCCRRSSWPTSRMRTRRKSCSARSRC